MSYIKMFWSEKVRAKIQVIDWFVLLVGLDGNWFPDVKTCDAIAYELATGMQDDSLIIELFVSNEDSGAYFNTLTTIAFRSVGNDSEKIEWCIDLAIRQWQLAVLECEIEGTISADDKANKIDVLWSLLHYPPPWREFCYQTRMWEEHGLSYETCIARAEHFIETEKNYINKTIVKKHDEKSVLFEYHFSTVDI